MLVLINNTRTILENAIVNGVSIARMRDEM